jgi:uncharacterized protein (DUF433 family)
MAAVTNERNQIGHDSSSSNRSLRSRLSLAYFYARILAFGEDSGQFTALLSRTRWKSPHALCAALRDKNDVTQASTRDPETMHGVPVFRGTRVPVQTLFDYLEGGDRLEDFLEGLPTVSRRLALEALEEAKQLLLASARCAS